MTRPQDSNTAPLLLAGFVAVVALVGVMAVLANAGSPWAAVGGTSDTIIEAQLVTPIPAQPGVRFGGPRSPAGLVQDELDAAMLVLLDEAIAKGEAYPACPRLLSDATGDVVSFDIGRDPNEAHIARRDHRGTWCLTIPRSEHPELWEMRARVLELMESPAR